MDSSSSVPEQDGTPSTAGTKAPPGPAAATQAGPSDAAPSAASSASAAAASTPAPAKAKGKGRGKKNAAAAATPAEGSAEEVKPRDQWWTQRLDSLDVPDDDADGGLEPILVFLLFLALFLAVRLFRERLLGRKSCLTH
jgi:hypothetical protein